MPDNTPLYCPCCGQQLDRQEQSYLPYLDKTTVLYSCWTVECAMYKHTLSEATWRNELLLYRKYRVPSCDYVIDTGEIYQPPF